MFFLIRAFFWIGVVFLLMPGESQTKTTMRREGTIATARARDVTQDAGMKAAAFCLRRADTCRLGMETAQAFGRTLERGATLLATLAKEAASPATTGSLAGKHGTR
jgi:hypothetical protein